MGFFSIFRQDSLTLKTLKENQYKQIAEWEYGPQDEDTDWPRYFAEMNEPRWNHYGIYLNSSFVGALSLEKIDDETIAYHVVTERKRVKPGELARLLLTTAGRCLACGYTKLVVNIPKQKRAAARLAIRCGMVEVTGDEKNRNFIFTKKEFEKWDRANQR